MDCDVLVVGLGPVGLTLVALLRNLGVRVIGIDRAPAPGGLPRAVVLDDAALRVLQSISVKPPGVVHRQVLLRLQNGRAVTLLRTPARTELGQPALLSLHQPDLEADLETAAGAQQRAIALIGLQQLADGVQARARRGDGTCFELTAGYLVGCDGAHSVVRRLIGVAMRGSTRPAPWTVIDGRPRAPVAAGEDVEFLGDPRQPAVTLPLGQGLRRWELMGDVLADAPAQLARWCADVELLRAAVYWFHARVAERWRSGRVLLAGDAAHLMPPFAGQGLGSGLRDAGNLAWRLQAAVASGDGSVLDGYERERAPHARAMIRYARLVGAIVETRRPRLAAGRDLTLRGLEAVPGLGAWIQSGALKPQPAGELLPQPLVRDSAGSQRPLDDLLGTGWSQLGLRPVEPLDGVRGLVLGHDLHSAELERWLQRRGGAAVLVRPDRVIARSRP